MTLEVEVEIGAFIKLTLAFTVTPQAYSITVGNGGVGDTTGGESTGANGQDSIFNANHSKLVEEDTRTAGANGGSGGGGGSYLGAAGGTGSQGSNGGSGLEALIFIHLEVVVELLLQEVMVREALLLVLEELYS